MARTCIHLRHGASGRAHGLGPPDSTTQCPRPGTSGAMKIPQSVRNCYSEIKARYGKLKSLVDEAIGRRKSRKWHYESRVKELQSFAIKLDTWREPHPHRPEDMHACTVVG